MKRITFLLALLSATPVLACDHYTRKYNTATTVDFCLWETDGTDFKTDAAYADGDVYVMKDEGSPANISASTEFTDEGTCYSLALTSTEMQAARVLVTVIDQSTKAWLDKCLIIETYGHASAQHAIQDVNLTQVDGTATSSVAELSSCPGSSPSLLTMLLAIYEVAVHKQTATSALQTLFKYNGSTALCESDLSDDGTTFTRGMLSTP